MRRTLTVMKRELTGYFQTPVAYVFIVIFLVLCGFLTFTQGYFFERGQADLSSFFAYHPLLYLFLVPALSMRLWAEERRGGTIEFLMTLPLTTGQAVLGKFLAAWAFTAIALALTFPMWITVAYLGEPDHGVIAASYLGSLLLAGAFLAIGACTSALTKNQVVAFVLSAVMCFAFMISDMDGVRDFLVDWLPRDAVDTLASFSVRERFLSFQRGVLEARDLLFFGSLIALWLFANAVVLQLKQAD